MLTIMKAKACTRCRQWKLGCDGDKTAPGACSRCRSLKYPCAFDSNFKRVSKIQQLNQLQSEVDELRRALVQTQRASTIGSDDSTIQMAPNSYPAATPDRVLGIVRLSPSEVTMLFRVFYDSCHPYLPFKMISVSSETIFHKCPLLFWVICAVASSPTVRLQLEPNIRDMIRDVLNPPGSVELVQALLILCMWPSSFSWHRHDPSFIYSGLATQIGLQIGLHRPTLAVEFNLEEGTPDPDSETKRTTWLACYVVSQMQASRRGLPLSFPEDFTLLNSFDDPSVSPSLSHLCHIHRLLGQSQAVIGASAQSLSGLLDPVSRINMVKLFGDQFESLWQRLRPQMCDIIELAFLSSRLQLWSFALHDDMPLSVDVIGIINQAEQDGTRLLQIACEKNLCLVPFYVCRSVCYAALILLKLLKYPFITQHQYIRDQVERARLALSYVIKRDGDVYCGITQLLQAASYLQDSPKPPTQSRMAFSMVFDVMRALHQKPLDSSRDEILSLQDDSILMTGADLLGVDWYDFDLIS